MSGGLIWQKRTRHADAFHPRDHQRLSALLSALTSVSEAEKACEGRESENFSRNDVSLSKPRAVETSPPASGEKSEARSTITPPNLQIPIQLQLALAQLAAQPNQPTENLSFSNQLAPQWSGLAGVKVDDKMESSSQYQDGVETVKEGDDDEKDTDSNSNQMTTTSNPLIVDDGQRISEEARKRRRQEINRESARRVRKRKSEAHKKLQEEVTNLKATVASVSSDQAVIVRYASELYKERELLVRRAAELESKWVAAECQIVVLRQQLSDFRSTQQAG